MYLVLAREGELVESPTHRLWIVTGQGEGGRVALISPDGSEECELPARLLVSRGMHIAGSSILTERDDGSLGSR